MTVIKRDYKRLLFVVPKHTTSETEKLSKGTVVAPFGVLSIVTYLEQHCPGVEFKIIDLNTFYDSSTHLDILEQALNEFAPDIVGLSFMYSITLDSICECAEHIKQKNPEILVVSGGVHASNIPMDLFGKTSAVDAISHGEGEVPFKDFLLSEDKNKVLKEHPSWLLPEDCRRGKIATSVFVENLDDIPPINYSYIDITQYHNRLGKMLGENVSMTLPIHSTRGCPYDCVFCCAGTNHGKKVRYMSPERFLDDVRRMITLYKVNKIQIDDDQFLFNKKRAIKILKGLAEFDIDLEMPSGLSVKFVDDEVAALLKKAGLKVVTLAIESGSPKVLKDVISKPLKVEQVAPAAAALKKHGLLLHAFFMFGLPNEFDSDRELSRQMMLEIGFDWSYVFLAAPFKGSRLFEVCKENGYLTDQDPSKYTVYTGAIKAPGVDPEKVAEYVYYLNLEINFVKNHNMKTGNYERAAGYFRSIAERYPFHAFAHYYLAEALWALGDTSEEWKKACDEYVHIIETNDEWRNNARYFKLPALSCNH